MLRCDIITIFPEFFRATFEYGIVHRARAAGLVETTAHDLRGWTSDKHHTVDDRPFGGGEGMVLKPEPIFAAVRELTGCGSRDEYSPQTRVILLSPQGRVFTQEVAHDLSETASQIVLICGRYEGIDERVGERLATDEISIGDYVLSGGEPAAVVVIDAVVRLLPGALGNVSSTTNESFSEGRLSHPQYTRPTEFSGLSVPEVLLTGNHAEIARWRRDAALRKTKRNRPDLLK
ncbi:MAG TPA: tRNA (guanosine(37)-N1)-methyltransferase TrmD [Pyrinomonadaceae bacterium]|nr:tRNA (guanosine(37)-N1)-methyltransferase TrmD [Pyrinomonadaceae bacterium]